MENLGDAYGGRRWEGRDPRRVVAGVVLGAAGVLAVVTALLLVTTSLSTIVGLDGLRAAEKVGGVLGGLGIPAMFLSVVAVLPSSRRQQVGVLAGNGLCLAGIALFVRAYPHQWTNGAQTLAFETSMAYFLGSCIALWFVLTAVASFRVRNTPGGTVRLELKHEGGTETVTVSPEEYRRYAKAVRSDGGETEQVIRELRSKREE